MSRNEKLPRKGDFQGQVLVGLFEPVLQDSAHRVDYFGLVLEGSWPYGMLRTDSGKVYVLMRKVIVQTTTYLLIQTNGEDGLRIDPRSFEKCAHGGIVKRRLNGNYDEYSGVEGQGPGRPRFKLMIGCDDFRWEERDVLSIQGRRIAPGFHVYTSWRENGGAGAQGGSYYTSVCYTASGEIFSEKATGFFIIDQSYLPHGVDWNDNDNLVWSRFQAAWAVFANEYDDGTLEWGHFSGGVDRFKFGVVTSNTVHSVVESSSVKLSTNWSDGGFVARHVYDFGGGNLWEFVADSNGRFVDLSAATRIWRGQSGLMQRVGERRKPVRWMAWQETFPERCGYAGE